jgi:hypothetical protein
VLSGSTQAQSQLVGLGGGQEVNILKIGGSGCFCAGPCHDSQVELAGQLLQRDPRCDEVLHLRSNVRRVAARCLFGELHNNCQFSSGLGNQMVPSRQVGSGDALKHLRTDGRKDAMMHLRPNGHNPYHGITPRSRICVQINAMSLGLG